MPRNRLFVVAMIAAGATLLAACGGSTSAGPSTTVTVAVAGSATDTAAPDTTAAPQTTSATATTVAIVASTCDWDSPRLDSADATGTPTEPGDDLPDAILGSWQHTFIDSGSGFEAVKPTTDIRYVLTSDRFLYCQDVAGATKQRENAAPLKLEGAEIVLPSPATGYEVVAWNEDTMVWRNLRDDSLYLLERR